MNDFAGMAVKLEEHRAEHPRERVDRLPTHFDPSVHWPEPDMALIAPERPPAPVMLGDEFTRVFGPWAAWLKTAAKVKGAPVDFASLALVTTASAIIGNTRWARPWDGWKEPRVRFRSRCSQENRH